MSVSATQLRPLEVRDYNVQRCETGAPPGGPELRVLDAVYLEGLELLDTWCRSALLSDHFSAVELLSVHRDNLDLRVLHESRYGLVIAKPELMRSAGQALPGGLAYEVVARYPDYGSQLVSLEGTPQLSEEWLRGRRLGLLDDPNSVSSYQIPMAELRKAGLDAVPEIVYFRSYREMYRALFAGDIDVIPALLSSEGPESALQLPPGLVLEETIPGPAWYIHRELLDTPAHCDLAEGLGRLAAVSDVDFFRALRLVRPCGDE